MAVLVYYVKRTYRRRRSLSGRSRDRRRRRDGTKGAAEKRRLLGVRTGSAGASALRSFPPARRSGRSTFVSSSPTAGTERRATAPTIRATWPIRREEVPGLTPCRSADNAPDPSLPARPRGGTGRVRPLWGARGLHERLGPGHVLDLRRRAQLLGTRPSLDPDGGSGRASPPRPPARAASGPA